MSLMDTLKDRGAWDRYVEKQRQKNLCRSRLEFLEHFVETGAYRDAADRLTGPDMPLPEKKQINKLGKSKKRTVYSFPPEETLVLKLLAFGLHRYDPVFTPGCCAFKSGSGARQALHRLIGSQAADLWCCKMDVQDYFNSIDTELLLPMLRDVTADDPRLYSFLARLLTEDRCIAGGEILSEKRGAMAGVPTASFLANLYLSGLDRWFYDRNIPYARYSDDIIFFAPGQEELERLKARAEDTLAELRLKVNRDKTHIWRPGEAWEFLGIRCCGQQIGLTGTTVRKLKGKLSRKARGLYRWKVRKGADDRRVMAAYARAVNRKLFENPRADELTWCRWFFPLINQTDGLAELDRYSQQCMRFAACGRHSKANYRISYAMLKDCGYRSLVHEYYTCGDANKYRQ